MVSVYTKGKGSIWGDDCRGYGFKFNFFSVNDMLYHFDSVRMRYSNVTLRVCLVFVLSIVFTFMLRTSENKTITRTIFGEMEVTTPSDHFTREKLSKFIHQLNFKYPDIVLRQAELESGRFRSKIFMENNNLFGMKVSRRRATTAVGENRGHAMYTHWRMSVLDYAMYYNKYLSRLSREEYLQYLRANYAEDPLYYKKIKL